MACSRLGWRRVLNRNWRHYEMAYLLLAALSTPLVLSVHSVVSFDFATSVVPGWHTTIFPPYFVAGASFGGFAMVLTILMPASLLLPAVEGPAHARPARGQIMAKIILLTGCIVGYAYLHGAVHRLLQAGTSSKGSLSSRRAWAIRSTVFGTGEAGEGYFTTGRTTATMMSCNVLSPQHSSGSKKMPQQLDRRLHRLPVRSTRACGTSAT